MPPCRYVVNVGLSSDLAHANIPMRIELSRGQRFVSPANARCQDRRSTVRCTLAWLLTGESIKVSIRVRTSAKAPSKVQATAQVKASLLDQNQGDNTLTLRASTRR